jgi:hypothetical protein
MAASMSAERIDYEKLECERCERLAAALLEAIEIIDQFAQIDHEGPRVQRLRDVYAYDSKPI